MARFAVILPCPTCGQLIGFRGDADLGDPTQKVATLRADCDRCGARWEVDLPVKPFLNPDRMP